MAPLFVAKRLALRNHMSAAQRPVVCKNGMRLGSERSGLEPTPYALQLLGVQPDQYRIVHCCEKDHFARRFICQNHGLPMGVIAEDIFKRDPCDGERPHIYVAGFPCQPFSSMGKRQGMDDTAGRGQVVYEVLRYLRAKQPAVFFWRT